MKKPTFEDLEETIAQDNLIEARKLWDEVETENIDLTPSESLSLVKEFKQPDDEKAYEIYCAIPSDFVFRNKQWDKAAFTVHCQKKNINLNDLEIITKIKQEIEQEMNKSRMEIDDEIFAELLAMKGSGPVEEVAAAEEVKEETKAMTKIAEDIDVAAHNYMEIINNIQQELNQLKNRVDILEEENRLLKEINKSLEQGDNMTLKKSTTNYSDELSVDEVLSAMLPQEEIKPKKRRGRPAGYKTSEDTKAKQRAARLNKLKEKNEIKKEITFKLSTNCYGTFGKQAATYHFSHIEGDNAIYNLANPWGGSIQSHKKSVEELCGNDIINCAQISIPKDKTNEYPVRWSEV